MFKRFALVLTLAIMLGAGLIAATAGTASAHSANANNSQGVLQSNGCSSSYPVATWYGFGMHIGHCTLQRLSTKGDVTALVVAIVSVRSPYFGVLVAGATLYLNYLKSLDRGNGVYLITNLGSYWAWAG